MFLFNISKLYFQGERARATKRSKKERKKKTPRKKIAAVRGEGGVLAVQRGCAPGLKPTWGHLVGQAVCGGEGERGIGAPLYSKDEREREGCRKPKSISSLSKPNGKELSPGVTQLAW